jgi:hypothetical protein
MQFNKLSLCALLRTTCYPHYAYLFVCFGFDVFDSAEANAVVAHGEKNDKFHKNLKFYDNTRIDCWSTSARLFTSSSILDTFHYIYVE